MKQTILLLFTFFTLIAVSCDKDDDGNPGGGSGYSVLTAQVSGEDWSASQGYVQQYNVSGIAIYAVKDDKNSMVLRIDPYNGIQTYPMNGITTAVLTSDGVQYDATSGNITVISDNELGIQGQFSFEATSPGSGSVSVKKGEFSVAR